MRFSLPGILRKHRIYGRYDFGAAAPAGRRGDPKFPLQRPQALWLLPNVARAYAEVMRGHLARDSASLGT